MLSRKSFTISGFDDLHVFRRDTEFFQIPEGDLRLFTRIETTSDCLHVMT
jgi:hypothetical protein